MLFYIVNIPPLDKHKNGEIIFIIIPFAALPEKSKRTGLCYLQEVPQKFSYMFKGQFSNCPCYYPVHLDLSDFTILPGSHNHTVQWTECVLFPNRNVIPKKTNKWFFGFFFYTTSYNISKDTK